jgi:hypothetical protein
MVACRIVEGACTPEHAQKKLSQMDDVTAACIALVGKTSRREPAPLKLVTTSTIELDYNQTKPGKAFIEKHL